MLFLQVSEVDELPAVNPNRTPCRSRWLTAGMGLILLLFLAIPSPAFSAGQQEESVSRAEYEALRRELNEMRVEMRELRRETEILRGQTAASGVQEPSLQGDPHLLNNHWERFAPSAVPPEATPPVEWSPVLTFTDPEDRFSMNIRGRIQPRFEYERGDDGDDLTRFRFRRLRLDFRGHVYSEDLTWRIMPEFRDNVRLDTAFVNYRVSEVFQFRAGQYNLPFAWERDVSSSFQQFTERSLANNEFQWPGGGGKDIGVMLHGRPLDDFRYAVGIFGGQGRNLGAESTSGFLYSGRVTWTALGDYPRTEVLVEPVEHPNLSFGAGAWYANNSAVRDWFPWDDQRQTADAFAATLDGQFQAGRFSTILSGFLRRVQPREGGFSSFTGTGFNVQGGYLVLPERLFGSVRYSQAAPDRQRRDGMEREFLAALQVFFSGQQSKITLEAGRIQRYVGGARRDGDVVRIQYQLLF